MRPSRAIRVTSKAYFPVALCSINRVALKAAIVQMAILCGGGCPLALAGNWIVEPAITVRETWTDNVDLRPSDTAQSDFVTEISPSIRVVGRGARVNAQFEYSPIGLLYARDSDRNDIQNMLNAFGSVEAIENFFFVEARGQISQQTVSAFGSQSASQISDTANRTETRQFSVSPYIKGEIGSVANYGLRLDASRISTDANLGVDRTTKSWTAKLESASTLAGWAWAADFLDTRSDYSEGADTRYQMARGTISYYFDSRLRVFVRAGREKNNFAADDGSDITHGVGFRWAPTERTEIAGETDDRFFGRSYLYSFKHRMRRSSWNASLSKDITTLAEQLSRNAGGTSYQRLFDLLASQIPDPIERAEEVRRQLRESGIAADFPNQGGFLSGRIFAEKRAQASLALLGIRNTVTFSGFRSESTPISGPIGIVDDFATASEVTQTGFGVNWGHKLTALSSLSTGLNWIRSTGASFESIETQQKGATIAFTTQLSPHATGAISVRHIRFDGQGNTANSYRENAVLGSISRRF